MFFADFLDDPKPISTMPGIAQMPVAHAANEARRAKELGLGGVLLFGLPKKKDPRGESGADPNGPVPRAIRAMKDAVPELVVMADVCVDEYTDHGHCGVLVQDAQRRRPMVVDNDATVDVLIKSASGWPRPKREQT